MCLATPAMFCRSGLRCPTAPRLPANVPGHSRHVLPLGLRCPTAPRLPANVPGTPAMFCRSGCDAPRRHDYPPMRLHSCHVLPLGPRCSTAPRLPANAPGTPAMFCRSDRDAPRRQDYPPMCLATPAMFCRSDRDAPRRQDYPPMRLALPPRFAARTAMLHSATITRQCAWLGCRIGQVPRPCKSNLTPPDRASVSPISGLLRRKHAWVCEQTNGGRHGGSCLVPVRASNVWEQTNGERHRGAGAVGVSLSSACECKRTANGIGQPPQCRFIVQHPPGFDKIVDMDMSAQCRFMVQHPLWPCPEFSIKFAPLVQTKLRE
jgi:hypothetical protein